MSRLPFFHLNFILSLFLTQTAFAACSTLDVNAYTKEDRAFIEAASNIIADANGPHDLAKVNLSKGEVCFSAVSFDVSKTIEDNAVLAKIAEIKIESENAVQAEEVAKASNSSSAKTKFKSLGFTDEEINLILGS